MLLRNGQGDTPLEDVWQFMLMKDGEANEGRVPTRTPEVKNQFAKAIGQAMSSVWRQNWHTVIDEEE